MKLLAIFLAFLAYDQLTHGYRILGIFPLQGKSHWVMMEQLMIKLAKNGHQVDVLTHFPQKKPIPNYRDISLAGTMHQVMNNVTATDIKGFGSMSMKNLATMAGTNICELLSTPKIQDLIKNPPKDPPYDVVIIELFASPCYLAFGPYLKVPTVGVLTSAFHDWLGGPLGVPLNPSYVPSLFSAYNQEMNFWERLKNTFLMNFISFEMNRHTSHQIKYAKEHFGLDVNSIDDLYKEVSLLLVNSHHSLNGIKPYHPMVVEVAGMHVKETDDPLSPEVQKWLDESKDGCVFFTFGSMVRIETFPEPVVRRFYKAFENIAPVRILMKVAKKEDLLPGLPKNVMTQTWFPQISVLEHPNVKAFITHGGLMSSIEAIHHGVPLIGVPLFGDQHTNIMNLASKNVAVSLGSVDELTEEKLTDAINTVLRNASFQESIQKLSKLFSDRLVKPIDAAAYWVEYVVKHKNILRSPAIRLSWWQRNLIDVYGFVLLVVTLVLGAVLLLLCKLKNCFFRSGTCPVQAKHAAKSKKNK
ncbi:hypothetical protein KM043_008890 [Ampulex compressa]|nr:hypothetical protein KM043_008890 [Ampulex compressa]